MVVFSAWPATGSFSSGLGLGAGFFLCWALAREIDPLNDLSAFVSAAFFLVCSPLYDGIDLGVLFWVLLLLRLLSGICGKVPSVLDFAAIFGLSGYLAWSKESALFLVFLVAGLFFSHWRYGQRKQTGTALLAAIPLSVAGVLLRPNWGIALLPGVVIALCGVTATVVLGFVVADMRRKERTASDDLGNPLELKWVGFSVVFLVLVLSAFWAFGGVTVMTRLNLLSSLAGVFTFDLVVRFRKGRDP